MLLKRKRRTNKKPSGVYAFIDSQNLNLGTQKVGWKMNWRRYREYLRDEYGVTKAFIFVGYMQANEDLYTKMNEAGYHVVLKPTKELPGETVKGNVDAELVLYASAKYYREYEKAIIVSGDGDFYCLLEYLDERGKLLNVMTPNGQYSTLFKPYEKYIIRLDKLRHMLEYRDYRKKKHEARNR